MSSNGNTNGNTQGGTVKLRDSCELCATAKVKCNKEKPTCSRCLKRGLKCRYGASRRHGRPAQNSQSNIQAQLNETTSDDGRSLPQSTATNPEILGPDEWLASLIDDPWDDASMDGLTRNSTISTSSPTFSSQYMQVFPNGHSMPMSLDSDFNMDSVLLDGVMAGDSSAPPQHGWHDTTHCDHGSCCMTIALNLLRQPSIIDPSEACPRHPSHVKDMAQPSLETIVSTNTFNIESISMLLDCSCAYNGNMLHLIWLAISNLLSWYARAVSGTSSQFPPKDMERKAAMSPLTFEGLMRGSAGLERFMKGMPSPVDGQAQGAAQSLLNDLYRIQDIVNRFAQRMEAARLRGDSEPSNPSSSWLASQAGSSQVEADLRRRLRTVTLEVVQLLVQG